MLTWIKSLKHVKVNVESLIPQFNKLYNEMRITGLKAKQAARNIGGIDKAVVKYCSTTKLADQSQDGFKASLQQTTIAAKAQSIALKSLAIAGNMLAFMGIAKLLSLYSEYKQSQQELIQNTREAANSFNETTKSIQDYADRYKALHEELTNANTTEERQHEIKSDLLTLQKELNEKYGDEYGKLNLVTDAYKDQTAAILEMNKAAAQNYLTENRKGNEKAVKEMERERFYDFGSIGSIANDYSKDLFDVISKYEDKGIDLSPINGGDGLEYTVSFRGDAAQADKVIHELSAEIQALETKYKDNYFIDDIMDKMSNGLSKNKKVLDSSQESYNVTLKSKIQLNDELNDGYNKAEKSVKEYNEALTSGDETKILAARDNLTQVKQSIDLSSEQWKRYGSVINDVFSQADTGLYDFRDALDANTGNLMAFAKTLSGKSKEDLLSMADDGNPDYFDRLIEGAKKYGLSVEDVISELERLKIIEEDISSTGENVFKALTKEEVIANINSLSEGFESLDKLMKSISDKDNPFDYALLDDSKFKEKFSGLGDTYTNFIETISNSPKDISACQSAFDDLVTTWIDSSGVLENLTEENAELATAMLHNMGITNAEEVVTSRLVAQQEHLAAQKAYTADMSYALANATAQEIPGLIEEATQSDIAKVALAGLALEKAFFNDNPLDTSGDIENVIALVGVVGTACNALQALNTLKSGGNLGASIGGKEGYDAIVNMAQNEADKAMEAAANYKGKGSKSNYGGGPKSNKSSGGGSKSKSPKSEEMKELDGIKRKVDLLKESYEELNKEASNSDNSYATQLNFLNAAIAKQEDLIALEKEAANVYKLQWETKSAGLSDDVKNTIMQGSMDIEQYSGTQYDSISDALSAWDTYKEMLDSVKSDEREIADAQRDHFQKQVDWDKQEIDNLKDKSDIAQTSYEDQIDYINQALTKSEELSDKLSQKANQATEEWLEAKKVIESIDVAKILRGELNISDYTDEDYIQRLLNAQDAYDGYEDAEEQLNEQVKSNAELQKEAYDKAIEYIESQQNLLSSTNSTIQSDIDLIKEMGSVVTADLYNDMISNNKDLMDLYKEQRAEAEDYLSELDTDSPEYYDVLAQIESCNQAIIQCKAEQSKWNEEIKRLPVERLSKYLAMLGYIKQDLQNFIDEQSSLDITTTKDQYQGLIDISQKQIDKLLEQQDKLKDLLKEYQYGSDKFNDVSGEIQDIDDEISSLIQSQNEWNKSILEIPVNNLTKVNEQLQNISNALGDTISEFDTAISAVTGVIDKQVQSINDLKDATSDEYENKIKPLQEELDLLKEKTEQENLQLAIEEAQADLEKAKQNTNNKVLFNGEWEYRADIEEMKNAQEALDDAVYNKKVNDLEKQIDGLEKERDKLLESYDEQIEKLDKIKDRWSSIASDIKLAADSLKANDLLGTGWENKVLTGNDDDIYNAMKDMYSSIYNQKEEYDKQIKATEQIADLMGQYVKHWLNGAVTYDQAMDAITLLVEKLQDGFSNLDYVDSLVGLNGGSNLSEVLANMQQSTNDSLSQLKEYLGTVQSNKNLFDKYTSTWEDMKKNIEREIEALEKAAKAMEENAKYSSNSSHSSSGSSGGGGSSSSSSGKGPNVNDHNYVNSGPGVELGDKGNSGSGTVKKYHSGVKAGYVGGSSSGKESQFAFVNQFLTKPLEETELPIIAQKGELVMTPEQQERMIENINELMSRQMSIKLNIPDFNKLAVNKTEVHEDNSFTINGGINITEASNVTDIAEGINNGMMAQLCKAKAKKKFND